MKKLFLLAASLAALWGCEQSNVVEESAQSKAVTKATGVTGYVDIRFSSGPVSAMQAHISFSPAIITSYFSVYFTMNKVYVNYGSWNEVYTSAGVETIIQRNEGNYSENVPARQGPYSYVDLSSFYTVPNISNLYNIHWVVSGLPTEDPEPSNPGGEMTCGGGCGHISGTCPDDCNCGCIYDSTELRSFPLIP